MKYLDISHQTYYGVANGTQNASNKLIKRIARYLGCTEKEVVEKQQHRVGISQAAPSDLVSTRSKYDESAAQSTTAPAPPRKSKTPTGVKAFSIDLTKVRATFKSFTWLRSKKYQASTLFLGFTLLIGVTSKNMTPASDAAPGKTLSEAAIFPNAETCLIDFTQTLPGSQDCGSIGTISIEGPNMGHWNSMVTAIDVPLHWTVYARYEKWEPPKYEHFKESGYVLLAPGLNRFDVMSFQLYKDFDLKTHMKVTEPHEMNDRIQYLIVTSATSDATLMIYGHKELEHPEKLAVSVSKNSDN